MSVYTVYLVMVCDSENSVNYKPDIVFDTYEAAQCYVNEDDYPRNQYKIEMLPMENNDDIN